MSKQKRLQAKQEKQNTPQQKAKRARKAYYKSPEAKAKWDDKKRLRKAKQADRQQGQTNKMPPAECILFSFEEPGKSPWCTTCKLRCSYSGRAK